MEIVALPWWLWASAGQLARIWVQAPSQGPKAIFGDCAIFPQDVFEAGFSLIPTCPASVSPSLSMLYLDSGNKSILDAVRYPSLGSVLNITERWRRCVGIGEVVSQELDTEVWPL